MSPTRRSASGTRRRAIASSASEASSPPTPAPGGPPARGRRRAAADVRTARRADPGAREGLLELGRLGLLLLGPGRRPSPWSPLAGGLGVDRAEGSSPPP